MWYQCNGNKCGHIKIDCPMIFPHVEFVCGGCDLVTYVSVCLQSAHIMAKVISLIPAYTTLW